MARNFFDSMGKIEVLVKLYWFTNYLIMIKEGFNSGIEGDWWTVTEDDIDLDNAFHLTMGYNYSSFGGCYCTKSDGYSGRCVKD